MPTTIYAGSQTANGSATMTNTILSAMDILPPDKMAELFLPLGTQGMDYIYLRNMGFEAPTSQESYSHFEKGKAYSKVTVGAHVAGAQNAVVTYTLTGTTKGDAIVPRVGEIYMFSDDDRTQGIVKAVDTSKTPCEVDIQPWVHDENLPEVVTSSPGGVKSSFELGFVTNTAGEGSSVIAPAVTYFDEYSNTLQLHKEKIASTGTSLTDGTYITKAGYGTWNTQLMDGERRMMQSLYGMCYLGKKSSTVEEISDPNSADGSYYTSSEGLLDTITAYGNTDTVAAGGVVMSDFNDWSSALDAQYVPTNSPVWFKMGKTLANGVEDLFADNTLATTTTGGIGIQAGEYVTKGFNESLYKKDIKSINIGFQYIQKAGRYFQLQTDLAWSDPEIFNVDNQDFVEMGLMLPLNKVRDQKSGKNFGQIGFRYKSGGGLNRKMKVESLTGFGANSDGETITSETDIKKYMWMAHYGNQFMNANQFIKIN